MLSWLRENSRGAAFVALVAMALQVVCTFGHVHVAGISDTSSFKSAYAKQVVSDQRALVADADKSLPSNPDSDQLCAICLVGHLVASAITSAPPALVLPVAYLLLGPPAVAAHHQIPAPALSFWSRGPPQS